MSVWTLLRSGPDLHAGRTRRRLWLHRPADDRERDRAARKHRHSDRCQQHQPPVPALGPAGFLKRLGQTRDDLLRRGQLIGNTAGHPAVPIPPAQRAARRVRGVNAKAD